MAVEARIDLRAKPEVVEELKKAAEADHRSLSQFLIHYGLVAAREVLVKQN